MIHQRYGERTKELISKQFTSKNMFNLKSSIFIIASIATIPSPGAGSSVGHGLDPQMPSRWSLTQLLTQLIILHLSSSSVSEAAIPNAIPEAIENESSNIGFTEYVEPTQQSWCNKWLSECVTRRINGPCRHFHRKCDKDPSETVDDNVIVDLRDDSRLIFLNDNHVLDNGNDSFDEEEGAIHDEEMEGESDQRWEEENEETHIRRET